jgi:hypothetical protein
MKKIFYIFLCFFSLKNTAQVLTPRPSLEKKMVHDYLEILPEEDRYCLEIGNSYYVTGLPGIIVAKNPEPVIPYEVYEYFIIMQDGGAYRALSKSPNLLGKQAYLWAGFDRIGRDPSTGKEGAGEIIKTFFLVSITDGLAVK